MEARLGPEAHDAIDEFLRLALQHEREAVPALGPFLSAIEALDSSVKRDMEHASDAVRVMTVHAAKGLEAKIVFLPDTCSVPAPSLDPVVFDLAADEDDAPPVLAWSQRKADDPPTLVQAREARRRATMREYRRLLYVAMTRAEERLYLSGFFRAKAPPDECWDGMIRAAFAESEPNGAVVEHVAAPWGGGDMVMRITTPGDSEPSLPVPAVVDQSAFDLAPPWLATPAALERPVSAPMRPSRLGVGPGSTKAEEAALRRDGARYGTTVHALLQHLAERAPIERDAAARAFLAVQTLAVARREDALGEALAVLAHPALTPLFAAGSRAEVPICGCLYRDDGLERIVEGKVDRLAVTADAVLVADFKTGAVPPVTPPRYIDQLALYRRVLQPLWPDRPVRALLIWTSGPNVIVLDEAALDEASAALLTSA